MRRGQAIFRRGEPDYSFHGLLLQLASIQPSDGTNIWRLASSLGQPFDFDSQAAGLRVEFCDHKEQ
jgi:hypothetical protein